MCLLDELYLLGIEMRLEILFSIWVAYYFLFDLNSLTCLKQNFTGKLNLIFCSGILIYLHGLGGFVFYCLYLLLL